MLYPLSYGGRVHPRRADLPWKRLPVLGCARDVPGPGATHLAPKRGTLTQVMYGLGRVLVVDDDEVIRQLIAVNLTLEGFDVATAVDGQDCLDKVQAINPDVITLDVMMPRLDGWETAIQLRKSPETAHIKVVLITARARRTTSRGARASARTRT